MSGNRLAVVGSRAFARPNALQVAGYIIRDEIRLLEPDVVISGGAGGVDTLARENAEQLGYTTVNGRFLEYLPAHHRWSPDGYKARNQQLAVDCTHLLCIRCQHAQTFGAGWTAQYARSLHRDVWEVLL